MKKYMHKSIALMCAAIGLYLLFKDIGGFYRTVLDIISGDMPLGMSAISLIIVMLIATHYLVLRIISTCQLGQVFNHLHIGF